MKKIAIVTFHRAMNCGAMLQAYALQEFLSKNNDAYILDYRNSELEYVYGYKKTLSKKIKLIAKYLIKTNSTIREHKRQKNFMKFSDENFNLSPKYDSTNVQEANKIFDVFIAGSDQIWNPKWSNNDWNYFLKFADVSKRFSYSASFGSSYINETYWKEIKKQLSEFNNIYVRERSGLELLKEIGVNNNNINVTCDPVFLIKKDDWIKNFNLKQKKDGYILIYFASSQTYSVDFAKKLSKLYGKKVIYFNSFDNKNIDEEFENYMTGGPIEFLSMILNADCVITTSFHALAFSLIFNTPFYYELNHQKVNNNSRLENLASIFGVQSREICSNDYVDNFQFDWNEINCKLKEYALDSKNKLYNIFD